MPFQTYKKRDLLEEVLPIFVENLNLQRLYTEFKEQLDAVTAWLFPNEAKLMNLHLYLFHAPAELWKSWLKQPISTNNYSWAPVHVKCWCWCFVVFSVHSLLWHLPFTLFLNNPTPNAPASIVSCICLSYCEWTYNTLTKSSFGIQVHPISAIKNGSISDVLPTVCCVSSADSSSGFHDIQVLSQPCSVIIGWIFPIWKVTVEHKCEFFIARYFFTKKTFLVGPWHYSAERWRELYGVLLCLVLIHNVIQCVTLQLSYQEWSYQTLFCMWSLFLILVMLIVLWLCLMWLMHNKCFLDEIW